MQPWLMPYAPTILAMGATGALLLVQLLVLDFAGIAARHRPGAPIEPDPATFIFRAYRAHANTNESIAAFILLALLGMLSGAAPGWLNAMAWVYVAARLAHMLCYYADIRRPRSASFAVSIAALFGMLAVGAIG